MNSSGLEPTPDGAIQELHQRVTALEQRMEVCDRIPLLERELAALRKEAGTTGSEPQSPSVKNSVPAALQLLERVWLAAPLPIRLEFLRAQLPAGSELEAGLRESARLLGLFERLDDLESWIREYPSMFVEAYTAVMAPVSGDPGGAGSDVAALAHRTLEEVRQLLETQVRLLGIEWIEPAPGEAVTGAHSIVEERTVVGTPPGRVSACRRRGFRWHGALLLPALIARQPDTERNAGDAQPSQPGLAPECTSGPAAAVETHPPAFDTESAPPRLATEPGSVVLATLNVPPATNRAHQPAWLLSLQHSIPSGDRTTAGALTRGLADLVVRLNSGTAEVPDYEITVALKPLLALLGTGAGVWRPDLPKAWTDAFQQSRPELLVWLSDHLGLEIFVPATGAPFSVETMQMTAERRTAHPHEWGTVARVEAPGLLRSGQVLLPARVVRYESGNPA